MGIERTTNSFGIKMSIITRFAPSPTGYLHIGGARTALFNWLYARHHGGKFSLRIEDTDRERSTEAAIEAILDSLKWLELDWDGEAIFQSQNKERHREVVELLLAQGKAYKCFCTPEELEQMRAQARAAGLPPKYNGMWRDRDPADAPPGAQAVIRLKMPQAGEVELADLVQGNVKVKNSQLDDMVLLRADGTPTYMLSVVVDDYDMGITHVIRGDDHLNNTFRQYQLYSALDWDTPKFAHIPLIHGSDGAKLSKRHGALDAREYRDLGFLPAAMRNYLLRLGWSHGDDEIISTAQAIEWFDLDGVGKSPARFDVDKLTHVNGIYMREEKNQNLFDDLKPFMEKELGRDLTQIENSRISMGMDGLKQRSKTFVELADSATIYLESINLRDILKNADDAKVKKFITDENKAIVAKLLEMLKDTQDFTHTNLESQVREFADQAEIKLGKVAQPLRVALTGRAISPSIFEVMEVLGKEESINRLRSFCL